MPVQDYFQSTKNAFINEEEFRWPGRQWAKEHKWTTLALATLGCLGVGAIVGLIVAFPPAGGVGAGLVAASFAGISASAAMAAVPLALRATFSFLKDIITSPYTAFKIRQAEKVEKQKALADYEQTIENATSLEILTKPDLNEKLLKGENGEYYIPEPDNLTQEDLHHLVTSVWNDFVKQDPAPEAGSKPKINLRYLTSQGNDKKSENEEIITAVSKAIGVERGQFDAQKANTRTAFEAELGVAQKKEAQLRESFSGKTISEKMALTLQVTEAHKKVESIQKKIENLNDAYTFTVPKVAAAVNPDDLDLSRVRSDSEVSTISRGRSDSEATIGDVEPSVAPETNRRNLAGRAQKGLRRFGQGVQGRFRRAPETPVQTTAEESTRSSEILNSNETSSEFEIKFSRSSTNLGFDEAMQKKPSLFDRIKKALKERFSSKTPDDHERFERHQPYRGSESDDIDDSLYNSTNSTVTPFEDSIDPTKASKEKFYDINASEESVEPKPNVLTRMAGGLAERARGVKNQFSNKPIVVRLDDDSPTASQTSQDKFAVPEVEFEDPNASKDSVSDPAQSSEEPEVPKPSVLSRVRAGVSNLTNNVREMFASKKSLTDQLGQEFGEDHLPGQEVNRQSNDDLLKSYEVPPRQPTPPPSTVGRQEPFDPAKSYEDPAILNGFNGHKEKAFVKAKTTRSVPVTSGTEPDKSAGGPKSK